MKLFFGNDFVIPCDTYEDAFIALYNYYAYFTMQTYDEFILNSLDSLIQEKNPLAIKFVETNGNLSDKELQLLALSQIRDFGINSIIELTIDNYPNIQLEIARIYQFYNPDIDINSISHENDLLSFESFSNLMNEYKNNLIKADRIKTTNDTLEIETYQHEVNY